MRGHATQDGGLVVRGSWLVVRFIKPPVTSRQSLTPYLLSTIRYLLFAICYLLFTIYYSLSPISYLYGAFESSHIVSPRILSLGGGTVAMAHDASAVNTNPAGLVQIEKSEINASYSNIYNADGLYRGYFAYGLSTENSGFGISLNRLSLAGVYYEDIFTFAFARQFFDDLSVGMSLKILSNEVVDFKDRRFTSTYDVGVLYQITDAWLVGALFKNLNEPVISDSVEDRLNSSLKIGVRFHPFDSGLIVLDWNSALQRPSAGFEVILAELLSIRMGLDGVRPSFGIGINYRAFTFDFGLLSDDNLGFLSQAGVRIKI